MEIIVEEKPLSKVEQTRLSSLEAIIQKDFFAYVAVGNALLEIRENCLYRTKTGRTWEGYCREVWEMSPRHADRLVAASKVIENLTSIGVKEDGTVDWELLPTRESQARELAILEPEEQRQVWQQLLDAKRSEALAGERIKVTAKAVKNAVKRFKGGQLSGALKQAGADVKRSSKSNKIRQSDEFFHAWDKLMDQIEAERRLGWRNTQREVVFNTLVALAQAVSESGMQSMKEKKIAFMAGNVEKLLAAQFGIFRIGRDKRWIEQMESAGSWVVYGEYESEKQCKEVYRDLLLDATSIQA